MGVLEIVIQFLHLIYKRQKRQYVCLPTDFVVVTGQFQKISPEIL